MEKRIYYIDLYQVKIGSRIGQITVQYFENSNLFFCKFLNDKFSDFVNSYETFGFYVDKSSDLTKFIVNGKFTEIDALNVWDQIERDETPIESTHISLKS
ncbi:MAG: hypothetical protein BroJett042_03730 [Bacteroidota bacterium]|nr:MAG: hypothetical protein BroJett042_03730 [Bacteroidota bacterium]